jgi:hypothetical protein
MKSEKLRREESSLENIVEALKSVPKKQLRIVRELIVALAQPAVSNKDKTRKHSARRSLLKTQFCGMWERRRDVVNGLSYARTLRQKLESRGDRS